MKHKELHVVPKGISAGHNAEAAQRGHAQELVNMREREECLTAVGNPALIGNIASGHRLLAIDGTHLITAHNREIAVDGTVVATADGDVRQASVLGRFIIITTTESIVMLHRRGDSYVSLEIDEAIPMLKIGATAITRFTATVNAVTFENPYRTWQAPLAAQDQRMALAAVTTAWRDAQAAASAAGRRCGPLLARYGVRLWDDSYLWMSQPIVVGGASILTHYRCTVQLSTSNSQYVGTQEGTLGVEAYALDVEPLTAIPPAWRSLVKAVDVLTTPAASPVGTGLDYRCATTASHVPVLEAGLKARPDSMLWDDLFRAQWTVVATAVPAADGTLTFSQVATPSLRFSNAQLAPLMTQQSRELLDASLLVHDGRLHVAPHQHRPINLWRMLPWCETTASGSCEAIVSVTLADEQGTCHVTTREQLTLTPTTLNVLVTYPDVRATHIAISAGGRCWQSDLVPWQEAGLAMAVAPSWDGHTMSAGTIAAVNEDNVFAARATLEVSAPQNPFVFTETTLGVNHDILAMEAAVTPIYNGGFGRYPIYLFTTGGILALAQGSASYGSTRPVAEQVIDRTVEPVAGGERVWFVDTKQRLCAVHGAKVEVFAQGIDATSLAWNSVERELLVLDSEGKVTVRMSSGRFYRRDVVWRQVFSDESHALAIDADHHLLDLLDEDTTTPVEVKYRSTPIIADEFMSHSATCVLWSAHAHDAHLTFKLLATRLPAPVAAQQGLTAATCPFDSDFLVTAMNVNGHLLRPVLMRVPPLPQRAFILEVTGRGTNISLHPTIVEKIITQKG